MIVRDGSAWPGAVLQHILGIPAVAVQPFPMFQPAGHYWMGAPDPVAYAPASAVGQNPPGVLRSPPVCSPCMSAGLGTIPALLSLARCNRVAEPIGRHAPATPHVMP